MEAYKKWGININLAKTECMLTTSEEKLTIEDIPRIKRFIFLSSTISKLASNKNDVLQINVSAKRTIDVLNFKL